MRSSHFIPRRPAAGVPWGIVVLNGGDPDDHKEGPRPLSSLRLCLLAPGDTGHGSIVVEEAKRFGMIPFFALHDLGGFSG